MNLYDRIQSWLGDRGEAGDRISDYMSLLRQDRLAEDPAPDDFEVALAEPDILAYVGDERLIPEVREFLTPLLRFIWEVGGVKWWYLVEVKGALESLMHGPYEDEEELLAGANELYEQQDRGQDSLFWLTIGPDGTPDIGELLASDDGERLVALRRPNPGDAVPITCLAQRRGA